MPREVSSTTQAPRSARQSIFLRLARLTRNIAIGGSIASWFASIHWIADFLAHLRVQYALVLLPCFALSVIRRERVAALAVGGLFVYNAWPTAPYFLPSHRSDQANSGETASHRILSFNVLRTNEQLESTLKEIIAQNADFVFLMEVQNAWKTYLEGVKDQYPHQKLLTDPGYTGVAFLSKYPWEKLEVITLGAVSNPSIDVQMPRLDSSRRAFRLIATHPLPPLGSNLTGSRDQQLNALAERFRNNEPNMMIGDLNLSPWSPRFAKLLQIADLTDASLGKGITPTLTPLPTWLGGIKVDHVLTSGPIGIERFRIQPSAFSDHQMVVVDFIILD